MMEIPQYKTMLNIQMYQICADWGYDVYFYDSGFLIY